MLEMAPDREQFPQRRRRPDRLRNETRFLSPDLFTAGALP